MHRAIAVMNNTPKIPIQNIYYLLCYAWNRLEERDIVDVSGIDSTNLVDLFLTKVMKTVHKVLMS